ncbi:MAG: hypothetical protein JXQ68_02450 [Campylobacterales bacterium]|nr:hypothetical protein [Campylobacterales bacterium]
MKHALLFIGSALIVSQCVASPNKAFDENMLTLKPSVAKLTAAIQRTLSDKNLDANVTNEELLTRAIKGDVSLLKPFFSYYSIKISRDKKHATVLICTQDDKYALFEDLGCTDEVDMQYWILKDPPSCDFHMSTKWCEDSNITNRVSVDVEDGNSQVWIMSHFFCGKYDNLTYL